MIANQNQTIISNLSSNIISIIDNAFGNTTSASTTDQTPLLELLPFVIKQADDVMLQIQTVGFLNSSINNFNPEIYNSSKLYRSISNLLKGLSNNELDNIDGSNILFTTESVMDNANIAIGKLLDVGERRYLDTDINSVFIIVPSQNSDNIILNVSTQSSNNIPVNNSSFSNATVNSTSNSTINQTNNNITNKGASYRYLQSSDNGPCNSTLCIESNSLNKIMKYYPKSKLISRIDRDNVAVPVEKVTFSKKFSTNSAKISISLANFTHSRILISSQMNLNYTVRLNIPNNASNNPSLKPNLMNSFCIVIDLTNYAMIVNSCFTQFDYNANKAVCRCFYPGLVSVITNNSLIESILSFQNNELLYNPYSIQTLTFFFLGLLGLLVIALLIGHHIDAVDGQKLCVKKDDNYDVNQRNIIEFTKQGFHEDFDIKTLFIYMLNVS